MLKPVNPVFPFFIALCTRCGHETDSMSPACADDKPFAFVCFVCQDDATREAIHLNTNEQVRRFSREQPGQVAIARRRMGLKRPKHLPPTPDWEGCGVSE